MNIPLRIGLVLTGIALIGAGCYKSTTKTNNPMPADNSNASGTNSTSINTNEAVLNTNATTTNEVVANSNSNATATLPDQSIVIQGFAFTPSSLTVKKGTKVTWVNNDSASHTVRSDSGSEISSSSIATDQNYSHTFNTVGTFTYHCSVHPSMTGTVTVTE